MFQSSNVIFPVSRNCVTISASCCIIAMFGEWRIHVLGLTRERDPLRVGRISQGRIFWPRICSLCRIAFLLSHVQHHICFLPPRLILTDLPLAKMKTSTQISVKKQTTGLKKYKKMPDSPFSPAEYQTFFTVYTLPLEQSGGFFGLIKSFVFIVSPISFGSYQLFRYNL